MLRWSDEQHEAWKAKQAREYTDQRQGQQTVSGRSHKPAQGGSIPPPATDQQQRADTLTLPWPPTGNTSVRHGNGGHYLTQDVRDYRAAVGVICRDYAPVKGRYRLHVHLSPPDKRRRDADNACKQLLDALVLAGYVQDDAMAYMRELVVTVSDDPCYGWAKVRAVPMEEFAA